MRCLVMKSTYCSGYKLKENSKQGPQERGKEEGYITPNPHQLTSDMGRGRIQLTDGTGGRHQQTRVGRFP